MEFKNLKLGALVSCIVFLSAIVSDLRAQTAQPVSDYTQCEESDRDKFKIRVEGACAIFTGDVRGRYHVFDRGRSAASEIDYRARLGIKAIRDSEIGKFAAFARLSLEPDEVSVSDAFAEFVGLKFGKFNSFGNLTYGSYALNANYSLYQVENSTAAFGYKLSFPFGTSIQFSVESPTENRLIPDLSGALEVEQNWGKFTIIGGGLALLSEGQKYQNQNYTPPENKKDVDLTGIGYIGGAGLELKIPGLSSTKLGMSGFYSDGALSKLNGALLNSFEIPDDAAKSNRSANSVHSTRFTEALDELSKKNKNYYVREIANSKFDENPKNELIKNSGIATNVGLTHSFSSKFKFHANGGLFLGTVQSTAANDPDGELTTTGMYLSTSLDFIPVESLTIALGFEHLDVKFGYEGKDQNLTTTYEDDENGYFTLDPEIATTLSMTYEF